MTNKDHNFWMRHALSLAKRAATAGEVPVGAVIVREGEMLGEGWNQPVSSCDATAHAEIKALRQAGQAAENYRLTGATMYVTLEPCFMCAGAMVHARIKQLIFGADDPKIGTAGSKMNLFESAGLNHQVLVSGGVLAEESAEMLRTFFRERR